MCTFNIPDLEDYSPKFTATAYMGSNSLDLPSATLEVKPEHGCFTTHMLSKLELKHSDVLSLCKSFPDINTLFEAAMKEYINENKDRYMVEMKEFVNWEGFKRYKDLGEFYKGIDSINEDNAIKNLSKMFEQTQLHHFISNNVRAFKKVRFSFLIEGEHKWEFNGISSVDMLIPAPPQWDTDYIPEPTYTFYQS